MQLGIITLFFLLISSLLPSQYGAEVYSITASHPLVEGQTLVSPGLIFELGFFSPNIFANKYVGLWHKSIFPRKYVWVANRDIPLAATDTLATLSIGSNGNLELVDGKQRSVWSANICNCSSAVLLDNGNFIVKDGMGVDLWVSFNDPSDTHLPSMLLAYDSGSGKWKFFGKVKMIHHQGYSWLDYQQSCRHNCIFGLMDLLPTGEVDHGTNQGLLADLLMLAFNPSFASFLLLCSKIPTKHINKVNNWKILRTNHENIKEFDINNVQLCSYHVSSEGILGFLFSVSGKNWYLDYESWNNPCNNYGTCGPFGVCKASKSPICKCLKGFTPKSNEEFDKKNCKMRNGAKETRLEGLLPEGKEIAVERLSSSSGQGVEEFKNEMLLISNLQHKNLVRIMGSSVKHNEKFLIYKFMPNKSLDTFLYVAICLRSMLWVAWNLWNEDRALELVDKVLGDSYSSLEVMTGVHVGLLCVQDNAADRPTMTDVALMLNSEKDGPHPKRHVLTIQNSFYHPGPSYENTNSSKNEASITTI
ncbi:putative protein kinase RLK-Pelle-DLSV family [Rosa chinensis]|uniref:Bulb-type lectin domain-containing protein n=1 Tax=Rosa chinensis TaxID=74649 RepID=A0A2P6REX1_ROSCH|nr:putative protein kinase RLK-Pelle-DLSV family [Rosa chinensis]